MDLQTDDLVSLSQMICETMLQLPATEDAASVPANNERRRALTRVSGAWNGLVAIDCSAAVACRAASVMFGLKSAELSDDDLRDGVLELANVVGGNIKALLPEPCRLSIPSTLDSDVSVAFPEMRLVTRFEVPADGFPMTVTVLSAA